MLEIPEALINKIFGDMKVVEYLGTDKNYIKYYQVECCVCGYNKKIQYSRLKNLSCCYHNKLTCNYNKEKDKIIGLTVNDYTIIERIQRKYKNEYYYVARCNICRTTYETLIGNFKAGYGTEHNKCSTHLPKSDNLDRFKKIYSCMIQRTTNPNYNEFYLYGGRDIKSDYYNDFMVFYYDQYDNYLSHVSKHGDNTSIERIDVNKDYCKDNIRWATRKEQANNKRNNHIIFYNGEFKTMKQWSEELGINYSTLSQRINIYNWDVEKALKSK